jgi:16S rRNA (cytosine967-C5)-methyltransferase
VLLSLDRGTTTLAVELDRARQGIADARDRALLLELTTGTLRWRNELDRLLVQASRRPIDRIDGRARAVLRVGAYQLRHLRGPPHAVVHESVNAVRALGAPGAAGFVNAVLRTLQGRGAALELPRRPEPGDSEARQLAYLSITLSHPEWLVRRWLHRYGLEATERWCRFNNEAPAITVRSAGSVEPAALLERLRREGIDARPAPFVADALRLLPGSLGRISADLRRELRVQDEASQLVARFAAVQPGERVLDVCAAPGGKTLVLASDLTAAGGPRASLLVAADRRLNRVSLLARTIHEAGRQIPILAMNALMPFPFGATFDCVLLDVPCSGLGTLRRDPDLKWTRSEEDLPRFAVEEKRMLRMAADVVRPGGRLVYATCSSEPDENREVVDAFLAEDARYSMHVPPAPCSRWSGLIDERGCLATEPVRHELEAFFAAVLVRRGAA